MKRTIRLLPLVIAACLPAQGSNLAVSFDPGTQYVLRSAPDGLTWTDGGAPFTPGATTHTANDPAPAGDVLLYQFWTP